VQENCPHVWASTGTTLPDRIDGRLRKIGLLGGRTQRWNSATGRKTGKLGVDELMRIASPATLAEEMPRSLFASPIA